MQNTDGAHVLGLTGMGGIGKTALATALFNDLAPSFSGAACFLQDVRGHSGQPKGSLADRQKELLSTLSGMEHKFTDEAEGELTRILRGLFFKPAITLRQSFMQSPGCVVIVDFASKRINLLMGCSIIIKDMTRWGILPYRLETTGLVSKFQGTPWCL